MQRFRVEFRAHRTCPLSTSCVSMDKKVVQSVSQQWSDPWSDHRIRKRSIVSLDILITLTLYKLARLLSGTEFCSWDRTHFHTEPTYMVWKNSLFGRTFKHWNCEFIWNPVWDAKTRSRESTYYKAPWAGRCYWYITGTCSSVNSLPS